MTAEHSKANPSGGSKASTPEPVAITNVTVYDDQGVALLYKATGLLVFSDLPTLTLVPGMIGGSGPAPAIPCYVTFTEAGFAMHLENLVLTSDPTKPPYVYSWQKPLEGGIAVDPVTVFDTTKSQYVLREASGTFFQGAWPEGNYFMFVKAGDGSVVDDGPAYYDINTIHYYQDGYSLILSEVLFQGLTSDGSYVFQQIGAGSVPHATTTSQPSKTDGKGGEGAKEVPSEPKPDKE